MQKSGLPSDQRTGGKDITGCRFSLSIMSDGYISMILNAIKNVNTQNVWSATDALSTVYRGRRIHVVDAIKGFFANAYDEGAHMTLEATFSRGSPADIDGDCVFASSSERLNQTDKKFPVICKAALYPLGVCEYSAHIAHAISLAEKQGVLKRVSHYAYELEGDVHDLFDYFDEVMAYAEEGVDHYVLQVTLSVNSPTQSG